VILAVKSENGVPLREVGKHLMVFVLIFVFGATDFCQILSGRIFLYFADSLVIGVGFLCKKSANTLWCLL
jgi:hypothetical protein